MKKFWIPSVIAALCLLTIGVIHGQSLISLKWQNKNCGQILASPAIGNDGTIFIGNRSNRFFAVNPNGTLQWSFNTGSVHDSSPAIGSDGTVFVGGRDVVGGGPGFQFFAFHPNGSIKWQKNGIGGNSSPALGSDGTVYFSSSPYNGPNYTVGNLFAFNPANGDILWTQPYGGDASPAVGEDGTIYHVSGYKLYAFSKNGCIQWILDPQINPFSMAPAASPILDANGTIYFAVYNVLIAADPNGTIKWKQTLPSMRGISELSLGSDSTLYFGYSGSLHARYASDGTQKWACSLGSTADNRGAPTIGHDGNLYYVITEGYFIVVNSLGALVQQLYLGGAFGPTSPNTSPALGADGTAYLGGGGSSYDSCGLYAFQTTSFGLADSPWPKFRRDNCNPGRAPATNTVPIAVAGTDQTVSAANDCTASLALDGSGSSDADADTLTYKWTWTGGNATGSNPTITLPLGIRTITLVVNDGKEDSDPDVVIISVTDTTPPTIKAPADISVGTDPAKCGATVDLGTPTASDNCSSVSVSNNAPAGHFFSVGATLVIYTAEDASGNKSSSIQTVTVSDNAPPAIGNVSADPAVLWPPNNKFMTVTIAYDVSDNCDPENLISVRLTVTCNEKISTSAYQIIDAHHVKLIADREGKGSGRVYTITILCTDTKGNSSTRSVQVRVPHDQGK